MKIFGIITEYNPFHNGHKRQLDFCRSQGADFIFCAMSGNFTQRGEPAVLEKRIRAKHAILCGADLVAELPLPYAVASARDFALGGVKLLEKLGCTHICFGSEQGEIEPLDTAAKLIATPEFNMSLKLHLKNGYSYPVSAEIASGIVGETMKQPNNLLGIEYIRAINETNSKMQPVTLKRNTDYSSDLIDYTSEFASASAIRNNLQFKEISRFVPGCVLDDLQLYGRNIMSEYENFIHSFLSVCSSKYLSTIENITEGLENRILSATEKPDFSSFFDTLKTKRYTSSKLKRGIFNAVLNITKEFVEQSRNSAPPILLLATKKDGKALKHIGNIDDCQTNTTARIKELTLAAERLFCTLRKIPFSKLKKLEKY